MLRLSIGSLVVVALAVVQMLFAESAPTTATGSGSSYEAVDTYLEGQLRRLNAPGAILAVVEGDRIVHVRSFGRARPGGEEPSLQTPFFIGSLTKSFTALAVMQLVEADKVDLDAPVQRYLPWFRVADSQASAQMTVRHLLNQTSGLPLLPGWRFLADSDNRPNATERQARSLATLALTRPVGSAFEYSNENYNLLGLVVEAASGRAYETYIQEHVFDPLGMRHSYTSKPVARQNGLAVGHRYWFAHPVAVTNLPMPSGSLPSGQLISCAEDMARYLMAHLNGGRYDSTRILSSAGIAELHRPAVEVTLLGVQTGWFQPGWYGMGWFVEEQGQKRILSHTGMVPDFYSYMALLPEQKKGVVLLVNVNHFTSQLTLTEVGAGVTRLLAGNPPIPIRFGAIPWAMRLLLLIPLLQIVGVLLTICTLNRWSHDPTLLPGPGRLWGLFVILPLVPNLALVAALAYLKSNDLLPFLRLFMPDVALIASVSGVFAGIWSILRTGLTLQVWHRLHL